MDEPIPMVPRPRPFRSSSGSGSSALQRQLDATRAALGDEAHRRETAQAAWLEEVRRHEATKAALAEETRRREAAQATVAEAEARREAVEEAAQEVVLAARGVLRTRKPLPSASPTPPVVEPVAARLASVLELVSTPVATAPAGADPEGAEELARRFDHIRARLSGVAVTDGA